MNRIDEKLWPAMEPPPGFADAVVERLLTSEVARTTRARRIYRLTGILLAALVVSGAAFGLSAGVKRADKNSAERAVPLAKTSDTSMVQRVGGVAMPRNPPLIVSTKERIRFKSVQSVTTSAPPAALPSSPSLPPRVPACQCQRGFADMICDCY